MRLLSCALFTILSIASVAQSKGKPADFSITLERTGCLGTCPDYTITISGDGTVQYEGRFYVGVKGVHQNTIPLSAVQQLIQRLKNEDFYHWSEGTDLCVDYPETKITATLNGKKKQVIEGCSSPGRVLNLADHIDKLSGAKAWIGHTLSP